MIFFKNISPWFHRIIGWVRRNTHQTSPLSSFPQIPLGIYFNQVAPTLAPVIDDKLYDYRDGQYYRVIEVYNIVWMAENLNFNTPDSVWYNNDPKKGKKYGRLYKQEDAKWCACPPGWRIPTGKEWEDLLKWSGSEGRWFFPAWINMKVENNILIYNSKAYNALIKGGSSGFNAMLGGKSSTKTFQALNKVGYYWSCDYGYCWVYEFLHIWWRLAGEIYNRRKPHYNENDMFSIRCVKDYQKSSRW